MAGKQGNVLSVLRRADNTLLDKLAAGNRETNRLRDTQLGYLQEGLNELGETADSNTDLLLAKAQNPDEVRDILDNQLGMFADKGAAAKSATARNLGLLTEESTKIGNLTKDLANRDVLETWNNKQTIKKELGELAQFTRGTPEYKQKAEEIHARNIATGTPDKAITDLYGQDFANANIQINPETIQNAIGVGVDLTNPDNFTTNAYNTAVKTISDRLQGQWTGIQDKSVFDAKAKDLISKSEWGQNFDRQTKLEAGQTTQEIRLKDYAGKITQSINLAAQTGDQTNVDKNINELLTFARQNNITGEALAPFNDFINIGLERTVTDPVALFNEVNPQSEFTKSGGKTPYISPTQANKLKNKLTERYRQKYPNLSDKFLDARIKQDFKKDGNLAFAIQRGEDLTKFRSKVEADEMKQSAEFKASQTGVLLSMRRDGKAAHIAGKLHEKLSKYMDTDGDDYKKIIDQSGKVIDRFKQLFTVKKGIHKGKFTLADTPAEEAFNLAINRAILGQAALRDDWWTPSDLTIGTSSEDADKLSDQKLMELFIEALPKTSASVNDLNVGNNESINVVQGIKDLKALAKDKQSQLARTGTISNSEWFERLRDGNLKFGLNTYRQIKGALGMPKGRLD
jgi:hypothetical protein